MFKKALAVLTVFALAAAMVSGCSGGRTSSIKIGMVNPLSGDAATYGTMQKQGMELAFEEINKAGGVKGAKFEMVYFDDAGDPKQSASGAQKFADQKDVVAIVGSSLSSCTLAMVPIIDKAKLPELVVSSSSPKLSGISPYFFRMAVQDAQVGILMAEALYNAVGAKKIAVLYPNNDYGKGLSEAVQKRFKELGGEVLGMTTYLTTDKDFSAILTQVKSLNPDAIAFCGTYTDGALIAKQSREMGITVPFVAGTGPNSPKFIEIAGPAAEGWVLLGVFVPTNPDPKVQEFVKKFKDKYGILPDHFAALAYDAAYVLYEAAKKAADKGGITRENMRNALAETNYKGLTGTVTFNKDGDWVRPYLYITVKNGQFVLWEKQPKQ